jgi:hypothetical protein
VIIAVLIDQAPAAPSIWSTWGPGLAGVILGFVLSELVSFIKKRSERKREHRRFIADQANRLMEDVVRVFFGAKNELGYLASELVQTDASISVASKLSSQFVGVTGEIPGARELEQLRQERKKYLDVAYANLKRYHSQGEPSVKLLCSLPIVIDLSFLNEFLAKVTETYQWDTDGVIKQCHLYENLHDQLLGVRRQVLDELLMSIKK